MFTIKESLYKNPIKSTKFGIFVVKKLSTDFQIYNIDQIVKKYIVISSYGNISNYNIAIPILHSE